MPPSPGKTPKGPGSRPAEMEDKDLVWNAFLKSAWGNQPDFLRDVMIEATSRDAVIPGVLAQVRKHIRLGEHAALMWKKVEQLLHAHKDSPAIFEEKWQKMLKGQTNPLVRNHLRHKLEKLRDSDKTKRLNSGIYWSRVLRVQLQDGIHPNSLRHLAPHAKWDVLIDETGQEFGPEVEALTLKDNALGRIVALALPVGGHGLPGLLSGFHAHDVAAEEVDTAFQQVLTHPVGVFGFTLKDAAQGLDRHWLSAVETMMRWVLRQLPLPVAKEGDPANVDATEVRFFIERRDDYEPGTSLSLVCRMLRAELVELDARYDGLTLSAEFIRKDGHPCNGYVDAIAYTWGSQASASKDRLRKSLLQGHCLLQPDGFAMQRLYMLLDRHLELDAPDWYALVVNLQGEPAHSLARELAGRLGAKVRDDDGGAHWHRYLQHVKMLLQQKRFRLPELASALDWLQTWKPADATLPMLVQLHWHASRLACSNHFGASGLEDARACLALGQSLLVEDAPSVCEADLRVAVAATNAFEFETAARALHRWIGENPAVPGLKNWCKVQSSLGQHAAFLAEYDDALSYFDAALDGFGRLQDTQAAAIEKQQTHAYRLIVLMDKLAAGNPVTANSAAENPAERPEGEGDGAAAASLGTLLRDLQTYLGQSPRKFARNTNLHLQKDQWRYPHHVFLRALVTFPRALEEAAQAYLEDRDHWVSGVGHPWPLIDAYRAVLLARAGRGEEALVYGREALEALDAEEAPLLRWMQGVLVLLLKSCGLAVGREERQERLAEPRQTLPTAPFAELDAWRNALDAAGASVLSPERIMTFMAACLPFNFH